MVRKVTLDARAADHRRRASAARCLRPSGRGLELRRRRSGGRPHLRTAPAARHRTPVALTTSPTPIGFASAMITTLKPRHPAHRRAHCRPAALATAVRHRGPTQSATDPRRRAGSEGAAFPWPRGPCSPGPPRSVIPTPWPSDPRSLPARRACARSGHRAPPVTDRPRPNTMITTLNPSSGQPDDLHAARQFSTRHSVTAARDPPLPSIITTLLAPSPFNVTRPPRRQPARSRLPGNRADARERPTSSTGPHHPQPTGHLRSDTPAECLLL